MATGFSDSIPGGTSSAGVRDRSPDPPGDGFFRAVAGDAVDLARAACGDFSWRAIVKTILTNDGFAILALWRMRVAVRYMRVPIVNSLLRRIQTIVYGIEIGNDVTLGRGVYFIHPIGVVVGGTARVG